MLFWAAWHVLPASEKAALAQEAIAGFVECVEQAASCDPRPKCQADPMAWHRHRIHPELWQSLENAGSKAKDPVGGELAAWQADKAKYVARRPVFSQAGAKPPWSS